MLQESSCPLMSFMGEASWIGYGSIWLDDASDEAIGPLVGQIVIFKIDKSLCAAVCSEIPRRGEPIRPTHIAPWEHVAGLSLDDSCLPREIIAEYYEGVAHATRPRKCG